MDDWKFEDMLRKSALYFARQDRFKDPFEGRFAGGTANRFSASDQAFYDAYPVNRSLADAIEQHDSWRRCVFISCWHRNTKESQEMWTAYTSGTNSVVITTSAKALYRFVTYDVMKSPVRYHGPDFARTEFGWNALSFYKPSEYHFEREFRMLRALEHEESVCSENPADFGRYVPIRLNKVVHRVITHPRASDALKRKVDDLLTQHLKGRRRENSALQ